MRITLVFRITLIDLQGSDLFASLSELLRIYSWGFMVGKIISVCLEATLVHSGTLIMPDMFIEILPGSYVCTIIPFSLIQLTMCLNADHM